MGIDPLTYGLSHFLIENLKIFFKCVDAAKFTF